jgi:LPS export ABC transporter protein LptC
MRFLCKTNENSQSITTIFLVVVMLLLFIVSCGKEKTEVVHIAFDPESTYTMKTTNVTELISDSGLIRYRIKAAEWYFYDKAAEPYWIFPKGFYVEKFDSLLNKEGSLKADTAYYYYKKELWELIGAVRINSLKGEQFDTEHLFFNQKTEKVYSDQYIRIEQADKIITGIGFESNMEMTKYDVFNSQGVFPLKETTNDTIQAASDSLIVASDPAT